MKGYTRRHGKGWSYVIELPKSEDGARKRRSLSGFATQRAAATAMRTALATIDDASYVEPTKETVAGFMRRWLPSAKARMRPSTWAFYDMLTEKHIIPALGGAKLQRLTVAELNAFYADLLDHGRRDGTGGLSPRTVGHIHGVLRLALGEAVRWDSLTRNPAEGASPPRKQRTEMSAWSAVEAQTFLASVRDDRLYAAYGLALTTGLRRGELLGLSWRDIDLEAGWLNVRQTVVHVNSSKPQLSTPKTAAGRRSVALDTATVELLREHRLAQLKERAELGLTAQQPDDFVFSHIDGSPLHPTVFTDTFNRRVKAAGLRRIRLHDLRHTAATLMLAGGTNPKVVQERLGHSSVSMTLDLYSHTVPSLQEEAAAKLGALILPIS